MGFEFSGFRMINKVIAWGMSAHVVVAGIGLIVTTFAEAPWYITIWQAMVFLASLGILMNIIYALRETDKAK